MGLYGLVRHRSKTEGSLGIDVTPAVLEAAAVGGAPVLAGSVFDPLPRTGQWQTALLLDDKSGLRSDPARLLRRPHCVVRSAGRILAHPANGPEVRSRRLRLRRGRQLGPQFGWATVHVHHLDVVAHNGGHANTRRLDSSIRSAARPSLPSPMFGLGGGGRA